MWFIVAGRRETNEAGSGLLADPQRSLPGDLWMVNPCACRARARMPASVPSRRERVRGGRVPSRGGWEMRHTAPLNEVRTAPHLLRSATDPACCVRPTGLNLAERASATTASLIAPSRLSRIISRPFDNTRHFFSMHGGLPPGAFHLHFTRYRWTEPNAT